MEGAADSIHDFFSRLCNLVTEKHNLGYYNTACLAVLLALPLLVLLTTCLVCCHCCCSRRGCCCCRGGSKADAKKKKGSTNTEDLWISVKTRPMTPDRVGVTMV